MVHVVLKNIQVLGYTLSSVIWEEIQVPCTVCTSHYTPHHHWGWVFHYLGGVPWVEAVGSRRVGITLYTYTVQNVLSSEKHNFPHLGVQIWYLLANCSSLHFMLALRKGFTAAWHDGRLRCFWRHSRMVRVATGLNKSGYIFSSVDFMKGLRSTARRRNITVFLEVFLGLPECGLGIGTVFGW